MLRSITPTRAVAAGCEAMSGAIQVANCWHFTRKVAGPVLQQFSAPVRTLPCGRLNEPTPEAATAAAAAPTEEPTQVPRGPEHERRQTRFDQVRRMPFGSVSLRAIARALCMNDRTVRRSVRSNACGECQPGRRRPSDLGRFV
jgi:hypothetical protein